MLQHIPCKLTFGFKAVEFGEYLNESDRQIALNNAYDGCFALAKALDIDPKFVGFNGMLGVAFGSRGRSLRWHITSHLTV